MNIFELTRILNEGKKHSDNTKSIINGLQALEKMANKSDTKTSDDIFNFLSNINGQLKVKFHELSNDEDANSSFKKIIERLQRYNVKSNPSTWTVIRNLLANLTEEDVEIILSIKEKYKDITNSVMSGGIGGLVGGFKRNNSLKRIQTFFKRLGELKPGSCGPYELLLCTIFDGERYDGQDYQVINEKRVHVKGDIKINGVVYEIKKNGEGVIDSGVSDIKNQMVGKTGNELKNLRKKLEIARKIFENDSKEGYKIANEYAKRLSSVQKNRIETEFHDAEMGDSNDMYNGIRSDVVEDYFSLLSDDDKKIAAIAGFSSLGYNNIIIVGSDVNMKTVVITAEDIKKITNGDLGVLRGLGVDVIFKNNSSPTASFGSVAFKFI